MTKRSPNIRKPKLARSIVAWVFVGVAMLIAAFAIATRTNIVLAQVNETKRYKPELVVQTGHTGKILAVAFSPDGKLLASGSVDNTVKLWDVETGKELRTFYGHTINVLSLAFSPDGKILASAGRDFVIRLWDVRSGQALKTLEHHWNAVNVVVFSPDGKTLASGSDDQTVKLWDVASGKELRVFGTAKEFEIGPDGYIKQPADAVIAVALSPDGEVLAIARASKTVTLWNKRDGTLSKTLKEPDSPMHNLAFSPDGKTLIGVGPVNINQWNIETGAIVKVLESHLSEQIPMSFLASALSPDRKTIACVDRGDAVRLWDVASDKELKKLEHVTGEKYDSVAFSPDGKTVATGISGVPGNDIIKIKIRNISDEKETRTFEGNSNAVFAMDLSPNGKMLAAADDNGIVRMVGLSGQTQLTSLLTGGALLPSIKFSPDSSGIMVDSIDKMELWSADGSGRKIKTLLQYNPNLDRLPTFVDDGNSIVFSDSQVNMFELFLYDLKLGKVVKTVAKSSNDDFYSSRPTTLTADPTGKRIAGGFLDGEVKFWDLENGKATATQCGHEAIVDAVAISRNGKLLASSAASANVKICDAVTGRELMTISGPFPNLMIKSLQFSPDSLTLAGIGFDSTAKLWDVNTGKELRVFRGKSHSGHSRHNVAFSPDGQILYTTSGRNKVILLSIGSGRELASLVTFRENDWAVVTPEGLFDASEGAQRLMHFVVSDETSGYETISLDQLKSHYHVPGLLTKIVAGKRLPDYGEFFSVTLPPVVQIEQAKPNASLLNIRLDNRGGGIGRVEVRVNGSELTSDARVGQDVKPNVKAVDLPVDIPKNRIRPGINKIEVIAWNLEGDVRSRNQEFTLNLGDDGLIAKGIPVGESKPDKKPSEINFYAIVSGISDYAGSGLHLRYAAKDAEDISKSLSLAARKYFCNEELLDKKPCGRVHMRLLSTEQQPASQFTGLADVPDFKRLDPTKQNYKEVFAEVAAKAKPEDVVVVYFSGHGTAITSDEAVRESAFPDMYLYPTRDATTLDRSAMVNETTREGKTVSSLELAKWISEIKADKKVMIFDTCAAGAAQKDLVAQARAVDAMQIRSIDRLRERTGFYILMGSSADAVSYEANAYRQGLLTYSLIEAMTTDKGLRDGKFLDVENWFKYSEDKVEDLAKGIGGVQRPSYFKSNFAKTFDIGRIERDEQKLIPLAQRVALILQPELREKDKFTDRERLTEQLEIRLIEQSLVSNRGDIAAVNYIKAANAANGLSPRGFYTVSGDMITLQVSLVRDEEEIAQVKVTGRKDEIIEKLLQEIIKAVQAKK